MVQKSQQTNPHYKKIYETFKAFYDNQIDTTSLPFNFNILDAQCGTIKENSHTNILMKLLEYKNQYGYVFLKDFIKLADFNIQIEESKPVTFETEYFDAVPIEKEENKKKQGRIDGLVYQENNFAIIIENKVNGAPPQPRQLERYIKSVLGNGRRNLNIDSNNVFVVFLTKDGVEPQDDESIEYMRDEGILYESEQSDSSKLISGPQYFACSYRYDILPWLENSVQPLVYQRELILNTGLVQYIDFLKGMLGERDEDNEIRKNCREKFNELVKSILDSKNLEEQNTELHKLYIYLQNLYKDIKKGTDANIKKKTDCINLLQSLVYEKAEEPMSVFMRATKEFFTSGDKPLIKEEDYLVNHHFTFYYIVIRDKKWPPSVKIGWYPAHLLNDDPNASLFYEDPSKVVTDEITDERGFKYNIKGKAWRKEYSSDLPHIDVKPFDGEKLKELYEKSGIRQIIESIKSNNKA